jgi:hypothetical protein
MGESLHIETEVTRIIVQGFNKRKLRLVDYERVLSGKLLTDVTLQTQEDNTVIVSLSNDLRILALCLGVYIRQRARRAGLKEIFKGDARKDIIGMEGNLAVAAYIHNNFLEGLGSVAFGQSDNADLNIGDLRIDVKTGTQSFHKCLMIDKRQWSNPERKFDFYVGCTEPTDENICIWGYATRDDVIQFIEEIGWNFNSVACKIPLEKLRPISELKEICKQTLNDNAH